MSDLAPCPACKRHVRVGVASCPFCATALPAVRTRNSVPRALTRAAIFSAALAGCQSKTKAPNPTAGSALEVGSNAAIAPSDAGAASVTDAAEAVAISDASVEDAAVAPIDAGPPVSPIEKKNKATRFDPKAKKLNSDDDKPPRGLIPPDPPPMPTPYGAPPARRRVV